LNPLDFAADWAGLKRGVPVAEIQARVYEIYQHRLGCRGEAYDAHGLTSPEFLDAYRLVREATALMKLVGVIAATDCQFRADCERWNNAPEGAL
jgi:hypothetical protein